MVQYIACNLRINNTGQVITIICDPVFLGFFFFFQLQLRTAGENTSNFVRQPATVFPLNHMFYIIDGVIHVRVALNTDTELQNCWSISPLTAVDRTCQNENNVFYLPFVRWKCKEISIWLHLWSAWIFHK